MEKYQIYFSNNEETVSISQAELDSIETQIKNKEEFIIIKDDNGETEFICPVVSINHISKAYGYKEIINDPVKIDDDPVKISEWKSARSPRLE